MPTFRTDDGAEITYRTLGSGPRTVVLLHGWMVSGAVYDALLEKLDLAGLRVIVPDQRGAGASAAARGPFTYQRFAQDVVALLDHEQVTSATLVGSSMGGQIAQWLAVTSPERVAGMVLLSPVPASGVPLPDDARALFRNSAANRGMQKTILGLACKKLEDAECERMLDDAGKVAAESIQSAFDSWTAGGFADQLGAVRAPTLVVATDDPFFPPAFMREAVVSRIAGARLAVLPGPGHYPQNESPAETAAVIQAFLAGLR